MKNKKNIREINSRVKEVRKYFDLTLEEMNHITGFSVSTLSEIERGKINPNLNYLISLNEKFNVNLNWLLIGKGSMFNPGLELNLNSGKVIEMVYIMENWDSMNYHILNEYEKFLSKNEERAREYLPEKNEE